MTSSEQQTPSDFLRLIIGHPVVVKLNSGVDYRGTSVSACDVSFLFVYVFCLPILSRCSGLPRWLFKYCIGAN